MDRGILADHQKRGKVLIPPMVHMLGPWREVSWGKTMIPEVVGLAMIQHRHGHASGVEFITSVARSAREACPSLSRRLFAAVSDYSLLTQEQQEHIRSALMAKGQLMPVQEALRPLISCYPDCPLRILFADPPTALTTEARQKVKAVVSTLYDRASRDTVMVQATVVWLAFDSGVFKVTEGQSLAHFTEVERYPDTELSEQVASAVRNTTTMFLSTEPHYPVGSPWPKYFWNRGLQIDACEFSDV